MRLFRPRRVKLPLKTTQLLLFVGIILAALVLNVVTLQQTQRYIRIFDASLLGYHSIQRLHSALDENRTLLGRYLREQNSEDLTLFHRTKTRLDYLYDQVRDRNHTGMLTGFEIRAIRYGLSAYYDYANRSLRSLDSGDGDHYRHFVRAEIISNYVFSYIQRLMQYRLSEELETHERLRRHANAMALGALLGLIGIGLLMLTFAAVFARRITTPIRRLAEAAYAMAHGDLNAEHADVTTEVSSVTEIVTLCESFNLMQRNIQALVGDLKDKAQIERKLHEEELKNVQMAHSLEAARLQGLQAQVNPHFLFNALNTVARVGMFERAGDTTRLIQSLANLLRYHLRTREPLAPLERELWIVREYVHIQEYRFPDRLKFEIDCQVDPERVQIPCFTIQPLVENAVRYGIEPLEEGGTVHVRIRKLDDMIRIQVEDSGVGMSAERRAHILETASRDAGVSLLPDADPVERSENAASNGGGGIGLRNVIGRLHLLYHGRERFDIESGAPGGTCITIDLPYLHVTGDRTHV